MPGSLANLDGTLQRWTDAVPAGELAIVAQEMGVTVEAILADEELQMDAAARHYDWLDRNGRLVENPGFMDYCTSQVGG